MVSTKLETFWHPHEIINLVLEKNIENTGLCKSTIYWQTWKITQLSSILIMILFGNKTTCRSLFWVALKCIKLWHFFFPSWFFCYIRKSVLKFTSLENILKQLFSHSRYVGVWLQNCPRDWAAKRSYTQAVSGPCVWHQLVWWIQQK